MIGVAGELAAAKADGPGSFAVAIIDALYTLDGATLIGARAGDLTWTSIFASMRLSIRPLPAAARSPILPRASPPARRWCNCATSMPPPAPWSRRRARLRAVLEPVGVPLLINDRVDVALAAEADGVHIGQDDMAPADARLLLGRTAIIGLSIKTVAQAQAAPLDLLDYVAIGGVYGTTSKDNQQSADRVSTACAPSCRRCARARADFRSAPSPASMPATPPT